MAFLQRAGRSDNVIGLVSLKLRILLPLVAASLVVLCVGIALFPTHGLDRKTLLKAADIAMYNAKEDRNGFSFFAKDHATVSM